LFIYRCCQVENVLPKKEEVWNSEGMGVMHSGICKGKRGVKTWRLSVVGYGYFVELPNLKKKSNT